MVYVRISFLLIIGCIRPFCSPIINLKKKSLSSDNFGNFNASKLAVMASGMSLV
ncbi:hypothetical protein AKJ16_DCAP07464 [Drosera capensis]